MILRIRFGRGRVVRREGAKNRGPALVAGTLLAPASLMAYALGLWRLASDLGMAREFVMSGIFSHWQLWMGVGAVLHLTAHLLSRYGMSGRMQLPSAISNLSSFGTARKRPNDSSSTRELLRK